MLHNLLDYQRAVVAIKLETLLKPKAKEQQRQSPGRPTHREKGLPKSAKVFEPMASVEADEPPTIEEPPAPVHVRKEVAKAAGLSEGTIRKVKVIEEQATPV